MTEINQEDLDQMVKRVTVEKPVTKDWKWNVLQDGLVVAICPNKELAIRMSRGLIAWLYLEGVNAYSEKIKLRKVEQQLKRAIDECTST